MLERGRELGITRRKGNAMRYIVGAMNKNGRGKKLSSLDGYAKTGLTFVLGSGQFQMFYATQAGQIENLSVTISDTTKGGELGTEGYLHDQCAALLAVEDKSAGSKEYATAFAEQFAALDAYLVSDGMKARFKKEGFAYESGDCYKGGSYLSLGSAFDVAPSDQGRMQCAVLQENPTDEFFMRLAATLIPGPQQLTSQKVKDAGFMPGDSFVPAVGSSAIPLSPLTDDGKPNRDANHYMEQSTVRFDRSRDINTEFTKVCSRIEDNFGPEHEIRTQQKLRNEWVTVLCGPGPGGGDKTAHLVTIHRETGEMRIDKLCMVSKKVKAFTGKDQPLGDLTEQGLKNKFTELSKDKVSRVDDQTQLRGCVYPALKSYLNDFLKPLGQLIEGMIKTPEDRPETGVGSTEWKQAIGQMEKAIVLENATTKQVEGLLKQVKSDKSTRFKTRFTRDKNRSATKGNLDARMQGVLITMMGDQPTRDNKKIQALLNDLVTFKNAGYKSTKFIKTADAFIKFCEDSFGLKPSVDLDVGVEKEPKSHPINPGVIGSQYGAVVVLPSMVQDNHNKKSNDDGVSSVGHSNTSAQS